MEKSCKTCSLSSHNNDGRPCGSHPDKPNGYCQDKNGLPHYRPIPTEPKPGEFRVRESELGGNWVVADGPSQNETLRYIDQNGEMDRDWHTFKTKSEAASAMKKYLESQEPEKLCTNCRQSFSYDNTCKDRPRMDCGPHRKDWLPIPKEPEKKTCKDCKRYEAYSGTEHPNAVMVCHRDTGDCYYPGTGSISVCFTPKPAEKPAKSQVDYEPQMQKHEQALREAFKYSQIAGMQQAMRPGQIKWTKKETPKPPNRKEPSMEGEITCKSCSMYTKHEGEQIDKRSGMRAITHCNRKGNYTYMSDIDVCSHYVRREDAVKEVLERITETKSKEKTMKLSKLFFFPLRRYVAGCFIYCTATICIWLNPKIFWVIALVRPNYDVIERRQDWLDDKIVPWNSAEPKQIACVWLAVIIAFVGVMIAMWLYNQFCKRLFGEK